MVRPGLPGRVGSSPEEGCLSFLERALTLAQQGFHVFPLVEDGKLPSIDEWQNRATRDPDQIKRWWTCPLTGWEQPNNIGICTTRFGDDKALLVVDVDNKGSKHGDQTILGLELSGKEFPATRTQNTPTGGRHLIYIVDQPVKQGVSVLGDGLDVRSRGGFIVAEGSVIGGRAYTMDSTAFAQAPAWIVEQCGRAPDRERPAQEPPPGVNVDRALKRAGHYLEHEAPLAVQGQGGDLTTFKVCARLKDFGVPEADALGLLLSHWNDRCSPPWDVPDLQAKVRNAYRYGAAPPGAAAPETQFKPVDTKTSVAPANPDSGHESVHPFDDLNKTYAFVLAGGGHHVLWETTDARGRFKLEHLSEPSFHKQHAAKLMQVGDGKFEPTTKLWMNSKARRSYHGICFMPGEQAPEGWYNLWRGFAVEPASEGSAEARWALAAWLEHLERNVCRGNKELARWLTGWFAHLVQRPNEKPLVALVFRGGKGVGKNALVELGPGPAKTHPGFLGAHSLIVTDRRYLAGNFNGHFENLLLVTFDEAFWSGDKQAEGILKGLITGSNHVIEHKGKEPYTVENRCRVVIIGNEDWLVPASHDERRFAVFDVGEGRKNDRSFFERMRRGMAAGGASLLLRYLLDFDLTDVDVNAAPATAALLDQKNATLEPFYQWWLDCLTEGWIVGSDFGGAWPAEVDKGRLRQAFGRYLKERNIRTRMPDERAIGAALKRCAPTVHSRGKRRDGANTVSVYKLGPLERHRQEWEEFIGHPVEWD